MGSCYLLRMFHSLPFEPAAFCPGSSDGAASAEEEASSSSAVKAPAEQAWLLPGPSCFQAGDLKTPRQGQQGRGERLGILDFFCGWLGVGR